MSTADDFRGEIMKFLLRNFPQIKMHGGEASVLEADVETGTVHIVLSGACDGCGISPMTVQAIKNRMFSEFDGVEEITVSTGFDSVSAPSTGQHQSEYDAPF